MAKIMLVVDDYNELLFLETLLKRVGFDVLSLNKESTVGDSLLGFMPELVLATQKGPLVDGLKVTALMRKRAPHARVVLLQPAGGQAPLGISIDPRLKPDTYIETPMQAQDILIVCAQLLNMDSVALLEKFERFSKARAPGQWDDVRIVKEEQRAAQPEEEVAVGPDAVSVDPFAFEESEKNAREQRYDEFLKTHSEPVDQVLSHAEMAKHIRELKEASEGEDAPSEDLARQKIEFVKALLKKGRGN